jgi:deoxyribonuclease (pyrimidine dimer)
MTRINSNISIKRLTDEHLLAEHREIKRLPACLRKAIQCKSINTIPNKFKLGAGHVKFFLDKQKFIYNRYKNIHEELINRGFSIEDYSNNWKEFIGTKYFNDYKPTDEEYELLKQRISERIKSSPKKSWHYYKKQITVNEAIELL